MCCPPPLSPQSVHHFFRARRLNKGHVTRAQFRQCLVFNSLLPPKEHLYALEQRFSDDMGVDYYRLLREVEPGTLQDPLVK